MEKSENAVRSRLLEAGKEEFRDRISEGFSSCDLSRGDYGSAIFLLKVKQLLKKSWKRRR